MKVALPLLATLALVAAGPTRLSEKRADDISTGFDQDGDNVSIPIAVDGKCNDGWTVFQADGKDLCCPPGKECDGELDKGTADRQRVASAPLPATTSTCSRTSGSAGGASSTARALTAATAMSACGSKGFAWNLKRSMWEPKKNQKPGVAGVFSPYGFLLLCQKSEVNCSVAERTGDFHSIL